MVVSFKLFKMIFLSLLSVRIFVDDSNFNEVRKKSFSTPVFCVFFSPTCPPCKKMHPEWLQFMKLYAFDPNVITAECDVKNNRYAATKLLQFSKLPAYGLIINGEGIQLNIQQNFESYVSKAEEVKKISFHTKCKFIGQHNNNYPAVAIPNSEGALLECSRLHKIAKEARISKRFLYLCNFSNDIVVNFSPKKAYVYRGQKTKKEIGSYIREIVKFPPLSTWNPMISSKTSKKSVIFVYSDISQIEKFFNAGCEKSEKIAFFKLKLKYLTKSSFPNLNENDLPAIIIPNFNEETCRVIKNIDKKGLGHRIESDNEGEAFPFFNKQKYLLYGSIVGAPIIIALIALILFATKNVRNMKSL
ncbi:hypothetical protein TRFO_33506 [Tritrichomonas foetus]|uniref:Thioredoxin domain-containing protein n=1 Tax=Tritrichomonas foetus TaxID=1144522 RepID=A0A1J4JND4_9EUKA|nr:hypothetical protein TRFO_33506 [Tritrichomonas foetus]|eukprot:OHS99943.1 hypothetical protein TRFO_33506 [Tritrichomonas foetus]